MVNKEIIGSKGDVRGAVHTIHKLSNDLKGKTGENG